MEIIKVFLSKSWEFFSIKWPGFDFSIGAAYLAVLVSLACLSAFMRMTGVSVSSAAVGSLSANNRYIKISEERSKDTK